MSHIADAQEFADWCVPLPKLRLITGEFEEEALGEMMRQIHNAIEGGEPPKFIQHIDRCPALIQVRLRVHGRRSVSRTPETRVKLDVFTSSNGIDTLCLLAFRVPIALYRKWQAITPVTELLGFDPRARWNERRESETMLFAISDSRSVPCNIWREMYRLSGATKVIAGDGRREVVLSAEAWQRFARWRDANVASGES